MHKSLIVMMFLATATLGHLAGADAPAAPPPTAPAPAAAPAPAMTKDALKVEIKTRVDQAVRCLRGIQKDGRWEDSPGITGLCLAGIFGCHRSYTAKDGPFVRQPLEWLLSMQQADGSVCDPKQRKPYDNYNTASALLAFAAAKDPALAEPIRKARAFLVGIQSDEKNAYDPKKDVHYGGIGYGGDEKPDLCNLGFALEALHAAGLPKEDPAYKKALVFINRCQDGEANDQPWVKGTGGYKYAPECVQEPVYGSMTCAGVNSLLFCDVPKDDPRVKEALGWLRKNFAVDRHPGLGQVSLFFYYCTMAKTLDMLDVAELETADGRKLDWRVELGQELLKRQRDDGLWANPERKYMEGVPALATAYALIALNHTLASLERVK